MKLWNKGKAKILKLYEKIAHSPDAVSLLTFLFAGFLSIIFVICVDKNYTLSLEAKITEYARNYAVKIEQSIGYNLSANYALGALVKQGNGTIDNFENVVFDLLTMYPQISSVQLAPNGVVSQIVPIAGNESLLGHNLFNDINRSEDAIKARETGKITFSGPFRLIQGGYSAAIRLPIYLTNQRNEVEFWGFVNTIINVPKLLEDVKLSELEDKGCAYQLWRKNSFGEKEVIAHSDTPVIRKAINEIVRIPNSEWYITAAPIYGWHDARVVIAAILSFFFCVFLAHWGGTIVKLNQSKKQLEEIAFHDELTGLPRRKLFEDRLQRALAHSNRIGKMVAVCYIDLDNFKVINDTYGHKIGDQLLITIIENIKSCLRETDTLARLGGDEFVIVIEELKSKKECEEILKRILDKCNGICHLDSGEVVIKISVSIGAALYPKDGTNIEELIQYADKAMYKSKDKGKGTYCFYSEKT